MKITFPVFWHIFQTFIKTFTQNKGEKTNKKVVFNGIMGIYTFLDDIKFCFLMKINNAALIFGVFI